MLSDKIFFNGIIYFVEGILLIVCVCCSINIYQVYKGLAKKNASYYFSLGAIFAAGLYMVTLSVYLLCKFGQLGNEQQKNRVGAAYTHLAVGREGRAILTFLLL